MKRELALKTLKYAALPNLGPRIKGLGLDFAYFAFLMAHIYSIVRLLPPNHPYLSPQRIGTYGVRHVMAVAANHVGRGFRNIDQMIVFAALFAAVVLLFMQFVGALLFLAMGTAEAAGFMGLFITNPPRDDLAFILMDRTFGVPEIFNSQAAPLSAAARTPFHASLHALFQFYSMAMLIVGGLVLVYYFFVVIVESAQTGTPFGQRFEHVYVPLRLCIAIGILVPAYYGLNMGQITTLHVAKWGSGLATNVWKTFNIKMRNPLGLGDDALVAQPEKPEIHNLAEFFFLAHACRSFYEHEMPIVIKPYLVKEKTAQEWTSFAAAKTFYEGGSIKVVFGEKSETRYKSLMGSVFPYCGTLTIPTDNAGVPVIEALYENGWWSILKDAWTDPGLVKFGDRASIIVLREEKDPQNSLPADPCAIAVPNYTWGADCAAFPEATFAQEFINLFQAKFNAQFDAVYNTLSSGGNSTFEMDRTLLGYGWAGAGIWFNKIAEKNGAFISTAYLLPEMKKPPFVMDFVAAAKHFAEASGADLDKFIPRLPSGEAIKLPLKKEDKLAVLLNQTHNYFAQDRKYDYEMSKTSGNIIVDAMNMVFGTSGLFDMRYGNNNGLHPFAQFVGLGKSLIENAIAHMGTSSFLAALGGFTSASAPHVGQGITAISGMFTAFAMVGFMIGFVLFYLIPFLPFLYFFFSAGRWVRSIFEAMVGIPLWALAHLKIDGPGLPGGSATNGYFLVLEIFLRPILTLFGFIAAITTFSAMAIMLHMLFDLVVLNLTGHALDTSGGVPVVSDPEFYRGPVDEFFYTLVYVIILYLMATSTFKLIDGLPNEIMRWAGSGASSFASMVTDPAENLTTHGAIGSQMVTGQLAEATQTASSGFGQAAAAAGDAVTGGEMSHSIKSGIEDIASRLYGPG